MTLKGHFLSRKALRFIIKTEMLNVMTVTEFKFALRYTKVATLLYPFNFSRDWGLLMD